MKIPSLKRIKVSSSAELTNWLAAAAETPRRVMLVTHATPSSAKYGSREQVAQALAAHGWQAGPRFALRATRIGHVIARQPRGESL